MTGGIGRFARRKAASDSQLKGPSTQTVHDDAKYPSREPTADAELSSEPTAGMFTQFGDMPMESETPLFENFNNPFQGLDDASMDEDNSLTIQADDVHTSGFHQNSGTMDHFSESFIPSETSDIPERFEKNSSTNLSSTVNNNGAFSAAERNTDNFLANKQSVGTEQTNNTNLSSNDQASSFSQKSISPKSDSTSPKMAGKANEKMNKSELSFITRRQNIIDKNSAEHSKVKHTKSNLASDLGNELEIGSKIGTGTSEGKLEIMNDKAMTGSRGSNKSPLFQRFSQNSSKNEEQQQEVAIVAKENEGNSLPLQDKKKHPQYDTNENGYKEENLSKNSNDMQTRLEESEIAKQFSCNQDGKEEASEMTLIVHPDNGMEPASQNNMQNQKGGTSIGKESSLVKSQDKNFIEKSLPNVSHSSTVTNIGSSMEKKIGQGVKPLMQRTTTSACCNKEKIDGTLFVEKATASVVTPALRRNTDHRKDYQNSISPVPIPTNFGDVPSKSCDQNEQNMYKSYLKRHQKKSGLGRPMAPSMDGIHRKVNPITPPSTMTAKRASATTIDENTINEQNVQVTETGQDERQLREVRIIQQKQKKNNKIYNRWDSSLSHKDKHAKLTETNYASLQTFKSSNSATYSQGPTESVFTDDSKKLPFSVHAPKKTYIHGTRSDETFDDVLSNFRADLLDSTDMREKDDAELVELRAELCITQSIALKYNGDFDDVLEEIESVFSEAKNAIQLIEN